jgi:hypothetical protein
MVWRGTQGRHRQMYDVTCSDEVPSTHRPIVPEKTTLLPGPGHKWVLVSSCWQVTRCTRMVSHGRWVWTWEHRSES